MGEREERDQEMNDSVKRPESPFLGSQQLGKVNVYVSCVTPAIVNTVQKLKLHRTLITYTLSFSSCTLSLPKITLCSSAQICGPLETVENMKSSTWGQSL